MDEQTTQNMGQQAANSVSAQKGTGLAVASMVLGIISVVFLWFMPLAIPCGALAIIFAAVVLAKKPAKKGMAISGLVLGIIAVVLSIILVALAARVVSGLGESLEAGDFSEEAIAEMFEDITEELDGSAVEVID